MNLHIHPKGAAIYFICLAASVVFASFYGGPVSFAWLYACLLLLPLSALYILLNYHFLRFYQEIEVHRIVRGEDHRYLAKIENAGPLPIHKMSLRTWDDRCHLYEIPDGQQVFTPGPMTLGSGKFHSRIPFPFSQWSWMSPIPSKL